MVGCSKKSRFPRGRVISQKRQKKSEMIRRVRRGLEDDMASQPEPLSFLAKGNEWNPQIIFGYGKWSH